MRDHEPRVALDGGVEGTDVVERLLASAPERLLPGGEMLFEIGPAIVSRVERLIGEAPGLELVGVLKDLAGLPRLVHAKVA